MIFVPQVLPEEEEAASLLFEEIQKELRLSGAMELKIGRDLVQVELETRRIEKYAVQQVIKAQTLAKLDVEQSDLRHTPSWRFPIPNEKEAEAGYCTRFRPRVCAMYLTDLKKRVEKDGPQRDEDLKLLGWIYGHQWTPGGEAIEAAYKIFTASESVHKGDDKKVKQESASNQVLILQEIQREITSQEGRMMLENCRAEMERASDWIVPPDDEIQDRIEKYRTANSRRRSRLLSDLEMIRRLKGAT